MTAPLRIALVHSYYDDRAPSGENAVVERQAAALRRAGHQVEVVARRTSDLVDGFAYRARAAVTVATGRGPRPVLPDDVDVVHVHNLFPNWGRIWATTLETPLVVTLHNYRAVCAQGMLLRDAQPCTLCPDGAPMSGVRHACYRGSRLATLPLALATRRGPARDPVLASADRILVMNDRMASILGSAGIDASRMEVAPNFLPDDRDPGPSDGGTQQGWLFVGRLGPEKGIRRLLERWPRGHRLVVAGAGGGDDAAVSRLARAHPDVDFVGRVSSGQVLSLMRASIGLVFPSTWFEGSPLVVAEALAAGLPILAFAPTAVADEVPAWGAGHAVTWDDDLATALDAAEVAFPAMRSTCRAVFEEHHSEHSFVERTVALYEQLSRT